MGPLGEAEDLRLGRAGKTLWNAEISMVVASVCVG
jgi:hypothetical protein